MPESTQLFPGMAYLVLIVSAILAFPACFILISRYRNALIKGMNYKASGVNEAQTETAEAGPHPVDPPIIPTVYTSTLPDHTSKVYAGLKETLGFHWFIYGGMCLAFALVTAWCYLMSMDLMGIRKLVYLLFLFSVPFFSISYLLLVRGVKDALRINGILLFMYLVCIYLLNDNSGSGLRFTQVLLPMVAYNLFPFLLILIFRISAIRPVGLFVLGFFILVVSGPGLLLYLFSSQPDLLERIEPLVAFTGSGWLTLIILIGISLGVAFLTGKWIIYKLKDLYTRKRINDIQLKADAIALIFNINYSIFISFSSAGLAMLSLLAFPAYKITGYLLFSLLKKRQRGPAPRLLLLRVFALGDDSRNLFERLLRHWRYAGSVQMISGPDLAVSNLEPHEVVAFVSGNLSGSFCNDVSSIENNTDAADTEPDQDTTYRVNEFFCRENNWKMVLQALLRKSDLVLMDLRNFNRNFSGCRYEIKALIRGFPLHKMIFVVNDRTDLPYTREVFEEGFRELDSGSVNATGNRKITLYHTGTGQESDAFKLLNLMCATIES